MSLSPVEDFFGFSSRPFRGTPTAKDYVSVPTIEQELERLATAAMQGDGVAVLTAAPGAGKTVVCERLRSLLEESLEAVVLSSSGFATRRSLLQGILYALGESYEDLTEQELRLCVLNFARTRATEKEGTLLIVDEAHLLNARLLEELRCLTNHAEGGRPLIRVVLCGQLPLEDALISPAMEALNYRITCHSTLEPLSMQESAHLVAGRLQSVGSAVAEVFTPETLEMICRVSDGNPRCLVQLCDASLTLAAEDHERPVTIDTVRQALQKLKQLPLQWNESAIDQLETQPLAGDDWDDAGISDDSWTEASDEMSACETSEEADPFAAAGPAADVELEPLPDWSSAVSSVEIGSDVLEDVHEEDLAAHSEGWSTYEPEIDESSEQAGKEPVESTVRNVEFDTCDFIDANLEDCSLCGDEADDPESVSTTHFEDSAITDGTERLTFNDIRSVENSLRLPTSDFVEVPVDDIYAELDNSNIQRPVDGGAELLDGMLTSRVSGVKSRPRHTDSSPASSAQTALADVPANDLQNADEQETSPSAESTERHGRWDIESMSIDTEWQSSGGCLQFDVVDTIDQPCEADASITALEVGDGDSVTSKAHHFDNASTVRPYARLFSRLRRQRAAS